MIQPASGAALDAGTDPAAAIAEPRRRILDIIGANRISTQDQVSPPAPKLLAGLCACQYTFLSPHYLIPALDCRPIDRGKAMEVKDD